MIWEIEEHADLGTINVLQGSRSMATVREDATVQHTVVTVSMLLPSGSTDEGKRAAERLMFSVIEIERSNGR